MLDFVASMIIMMAVVHFDHEEVKEPNSYKYPMDEKVIDPNHYEESN